MVDQKRLAFCERSIIVKYAFGSLLNPHSDLFGILLELLNFRFHSLPEIRIARFPHVIIESGTVF